MFKINSLQAEKRVNEQKKELFKDNFLFFSLYDKLSCINWNKHRMSKQKNEK